MNDAELAQALFAAALDRVQPQRILPPHLARVRDLYGKERFQRLVALGFGKAAVPMALVTEEVVGDLISGGLVIAPHSALPAALPKSLEVATAAHPYPDAAGVAATRRLMALAQEADHRTLLLLLISGGGSSLLVAPAPGISLEEIRQTARLLMEAGADIEELNTVRKHLSAVKGGQLAALAYPARVVGFAISDVPQDREDLIASGPAVPDPSTFAEALGVVERLHLAGKVPDAVLARLRAGMAGRVPETPKPGDPTFERVTTTVIAGNRDARDAAAAAARERGVATVVAAEEVTGEARVAGRMLAERALQERGRLAPGQRLVIISGGETTVQVLGKGKGGRNQEVAVAFALAVAGEQGVTLLSAGTDGIDGPTDAAGGVVDGNTVAAARSMGLAPEKALADNDAYPLLERCGALVKIGATGTNVRDIQIAVLSGRR